MKRLALICLVFCSSLLGQTNAHGAESVFEVASIKPSASTDPRALFLAVPGRLLMQGFAARAFIFLAYGVAEYQLVGGPSWIRSDHYDVEAKAQGDTPVRQMQGPMLQALLVERFKLAFHRETQQLPVYELTRVGGKTKFQPTQEGSCIPYSLDAAPSSAALSTKFCGLGLPQNGTIRTLDGKGVSMAALANAIARVVQRSIIDKTGLTGTYDVHLQWTDALSNSPAPEASDSPSIFTAVDDQLGLKLKSAKGPVDVIVIDHMERPSEN